MSLINLFWDFSITISYGICLKKYFLYACLKDLARICFVLILIIIHRQYMYISNHALSFINMTWQKKIKI